MQVAKYGRSRFFAVYDAAGELVVVTVYKRGAKEVVRRLTPPLLTPPLTAIRSTREAVTEASAQVDAPSVLSSLTLSRERKPA